MTVFLPLTEMKSRWNCGSITCIMCLTCVGSQLSMSSSSASSFSVPLQLSHEPEAFITGALQQWPLGTQIIQKQHPHLHAFIMTQGCK
uniref:Secreted protein n=1 Tax=Paramormyrops kingsleyae TaxID=1676925 RepID=A0A3B3SWE9_9TELE